MTQIHAQAAAAMDAPAEIVYNILADYQVGHPAILPEPYFTGLSVEQGGRGAGTVIITRMKVMGAERTFRMAVTEPQPGCVLVESDGTTTTTLRSNRWVKVLVESRSLRTPSLRRAYSAGSSACPPRHFCAGSTVKS